MSAGRTFSLPGGEHNATPPRLLFGAGAVANVPVEVERLGARRALLLSTPGRAPLAEKIAADLGERCVGVLPEAVSQVPIELARRGARHAQDLGADCLVAVGGGAGTGLGKGIAYHHPLPVIDVPTTYSGSEMTAFCGMTIEGVKRMHQGPHMLAATVVYDPELSVSLPRHVSAASAMNALAHCIDAVYLPTTSPLLGPVAVEGARVLSAALPAVLAAPDDPGARSEMLYGSMLAGAALAGGFALQHAVAHALGGSYGVEHGESHAVVLPYVTAHLARRAPRDLGRIATAVGLAHADELAGHVWDLVTAAGLPHRLGDVGLGAQAVERIVAITAQEAAERARHGAPDDVWAGVNPAPTDADTVHAVLTAALAGERP